MRDNFFKKFKNCLHRLDKFPAYIDQGVGKAIKYGFLISLIFGGILGIYNNFVSNSYLNKSIQDINKPEYAFTVKDNTLDMKGGPININNNGISIYINDEKTLSDAQSIMNNYQNSAATILVLKNGIELNAAGQSQSQDYNAISTQIFGSQEINNQTLVSKLQQWKKYYFAFQFFYNVMERFINLIIDSLFIAVIGMIASMFMGMMVKPSALYSLGIYAATVPFLISLPIGILYPSISLQTPLVIATAIYVIIILKHIKNDLVQRRNNATGNKNDLNKFL